MTQRARQHQLEDFSRRKYALALPEEWVKRDKHSDYGIDVEVEIFDKNNLPTGLVYLVQLKATETDNESDARRLDFRIDKIRYYKSLELPVLIVRHSIKKDIFYCKWAHEVDLFYAKENAKTIRLTFHKEDIWTDDSASETVKFLKRVNAVKSGQLTLPISVYMDIKGDSIHGIPRGVFMASYRSYLQPYSQIATYESDPDKAILYIILQEDKLVIKLASITGCTFHNMQDRATEGFVKGVVADVLLGLAASLSNIGQIEMAARIFLEGDLKERFFRKQDLLLRYMPTLLATSRYEEVVDSVCEIIDAQEDNLLESVTTISAIIVAGHRSRDRATGFRKLLHKCLVKNIARDERSLIGISHYNLGNHYRNRGSFKESVVHYLKARRFESNYLNQSYYYYELAGVLFGLEKYYFSARLYKLALDKGAPAFIRPRYADALMLSGSYKLARDTFAEYLDSCDEEKHAEWHLKKWCLDGLIEHTGMEDQVRHKEKAPSIIDISKAGTPSFIRNLEAAIELDALCSLAWFNLGIEQNRTGKHAAAAFSFILCGLVQTGDIEAWVNATLCCLKSNAYSVLSPTISTAYFFNGDDYLASLHKELKDQVDASVFEQIVNLIEQMLPDDQNENERPKIRLMGKDGIFLDIVTGENT